MRELLREVVYSRRQKLPGMTDPLTSQLPAAGIVPPTKRIKIDSVGDGTGELTARASGRDGRTSPGKTRSPCLCSGL